MSDFANPRTLLGKTFEQFLIRGGEGDGGGGKHFEESDDGGHLVVFILIVVTLVVVFISCENRNDEDGTDAENAGNGGVDAGIELGIDGKLRLAGLEGGSGESVASIERDAEIGSEVSGGGTADHFVSADESESSGRGMSSLGGANDKLVENQIESEIGRKTSANVPLERIGTGRFDAKVMGRIIGRMMGRIRGRLFGAELRPRHRLLEHICVPAATLVWSASLEPSLPRNRGEVNAMVVAESDHDHVPSVRFEFPFLSGLAQTLRSTVCCAEKGCYSNKNCTPTSRNAAEIYQGEQARYAHCGGRFGICRVGDGSVFC